MSRILIHNAFIVNEGSTKQGSLVMEEGRIAEVLTDGKPLSAPCDEVIDATGCYLLPGIIDDHVHFRDPGFTQKADMLTESRAAAAGGVTSIMDMPNTNPQTTTLEALEEKMKMLDERCLVNHSCYFGATDNNYRLFQELDKRRVCGIKLFMGSSTGNMLVSGMRQLIHVFTAAGDLLIAAHCEDQAIIAKNAALAEKQAVNGVVNVATHSFIRSAKACEASTRLATELAQETGARLHVLHLSSNRELKYFSTKPIEEKRITAEACIGHLWFQQSDYNRQGALIKVNPAIKSKSDRDHLRAALTEGRIDVIGTDHAPHLLCDKEGGALKAASGMPMIQFSLVAMLELVNQGVLPIELMVEKMCHNPAKLFHIAQRGFIREGYKADLVLVRKGEPWTVSNEQVLSKCGWTPLAGTQFSWRVEKTFVNGHQVFDGKQVDESQRGEALLFER